jgi:hypothetical protein
MKEVFFYFNLYHGITEREVIEIFRSFPYLFCCDLTKMQRFMGEFRKYKMSKEQIIKMVILLYSHIPHSANKVEVFWQAEWEPLLDCSTI